MCNRQCYDVRALHILQVVESPVIEPAFARMQVGLRSLKVPCHGMHSWMTCIQYHPHTVCTFCRQQDGHSNNSAWHFMATTATGNVVYTYRGSHQRGSCSLGEVFSSSAWCLLITVH